MRQVQESITISTRGRGLYDATDPLGAWLRAHQAETGLLTVFIQHTSASLLIQENADPAVLEDLERFFARLIPDGEPLFRHTEEGPDDMPSHVRSALTQTSLQIPVANGRLCLGTWQGIFVYEHRHAAHRRSLVLHYIGT